MPVTPPLLEKQVSALKVVYLRLYFTFFVLIDAPVKMKKNKFSESKKIKDVISKSVNKAVESEMRARAAESTINLNKTQQAIAQHLKNTKS